jgi:hypothetical protein
LYNIQHWTKKNRTEPAPVIKLSLEIKGQKQIKSKFCSFKNNIHEPAFSLQCCTNIFCLYPWLR